jgi:dTDP-4-amino-4,6-dideoxygalactose transaminase
LKANAIPVFADIDLDTANLDPGAVEKAITSKTRAIMPVHFAGLPADMDAFKILARKHKLRLIEDACHSWGSRWKGRGTGALGDCGVFSFQMSKNITAGEGGIILTNNEEIADTARSYSNCGRGKNRGFYDHYLLGSNLRMTELQAAILLGQLTRLKAQTIQRQKNAALLDRGLKGIPGIALLRNDPRVTRRAYHIYVFRFVTEEWGGVSRETFFKALQAEGISSYGGYPVPLYKNPLFRKTGKGPRYCPVSCPYYGRKIDYPRVNCPNTEQICREACWIKQADLLAGPADMKDIVMAVAKVWEHRKEL